MAVDRAGALVKSRMNAEVRAQTVPLIPGRTWKERELKALAERYAGALVDVAIENKQADLIKRELAQFAAMVRESPSYTRFSRIPRSCARSSMP